MIAKILHSSFRTKNECSSISEMRKLLDYSKGDISQITNIDLSDNPTLSKNQQFRLLQKFMGNLSNRIYMLNLAYCNLINESKIRNIWKALNNFETIDWFNFVQFEYDSDTLNESEGFLCVIKEEMMFNTSILSLELFNDETKQKQICPNIERELQANNEIREKFPDLIGNSTIKDCHTVDMKLI